jgi:hypothetical protein
MNFKDEKEVKVVLKQKYNNRNIFNNVRIYQMIIGISISLYSISIFNWVGL